MQTLTLAKKKAKEIIRGLIPANVLKDRYIYRRLGKRAGRKYLQLRALDMAGFKSQNAHRVPIDGRSWTEHRLRHVRHDPRFAAKAFGCRL